MQMNVKVLWYEASPYVYVVVSLASLLFSSSGIGLMFSALLLTASLSILRMRRIYRSPGARKHRKYSRAG
jgi:hypothetical protein